MKIAWESEFAQFLTDLSAVQSETLEVLSRKRELLVAADAEGLSEIAHREQELIGRLQSCLEHRQRLLDQAADAGLPSDSIRSLSAALPAAETDWAGQLDETARQARLLQHHSLTNWVLVQRTLIHLSQVLEIIATGGRSKPTYEKGSSAETTGALVDRVA